MRLVGLLFVSVVLIMAAAMPRFLSKPQVRPSISPIPFVAEFAREHAEYWQFGEPYPAGLVGEETKRILRADDALLLVRRSTPEVQVLIFYWHPGKAAVHEVAEHTPFRCWTKSGMELIDSGTLTVGFQAGLIRGRKGTFRAAGSSTIQTCFFHAVDGEFQILDLRPEGSVSKLARYSSEFEQFLGSSRSQLFVRIHTEGSLDAALSDRELSLLLNFLFRRLLETNSILKL